MLLFLGEGKREGEKKRVDRFVSQQLSIPERPVSVVRASEVSCLKRNAFTILAVFLGEIFSLERRIGRGERDGGG